MHFMGKRMSWVFGLLAGPVALGACAFGAVQSGRASGHAMGERVN